MGKTLGAGTYGIVREADAPEGKVAVKIILKKNMKGNEQMVYDELDLLKMCHHANIVKFVDWFESKVGVTYISWQLLIICRTSFTSLRNLLQAASYLTEFAARDASQKRMARRQFGRCWKPWTTYTAGTSSIEI